LTEENILVTVVSKKISVKLRSEFNNENIQYDPVSFNRNGLSIFSDLLTFFNIFKHLRRYRPDLVLAFTIKPVIWSGIASRFLNINFYALITGLGYSFHGETKRRKLLTMLVSSLYKLALKKSNSVIFQNLDSRDIFVKKGIIPFSKTYVVNGSGVDIKRFPITKLPNENITFLCLSRLLGEKGLREYSEAAKIVKNKFPDAVFNLLGPEDSSFDAISLVEVESWSDFVNYKGVVDDVRECISASHIYVLPSYHEGLPRSVLEAMSMGRPIITTDAVGCRETVEEGVNGFKVPVKSVESLVEKMIWFINNSDRIRTMGLKSRKIVENRFDVQKVNKKILKIMNIK
jgi:glycosyltransferase involved in cell wall biosynthesis